MSFTKNPDEILNYTMSADIGVNLINRIGEAQEFQSPWKLFEYCMAGLAVVSTDLPFHRRVYKKYNIGFLCDNNNSPKSIANRVNKILENEGTLKDYQKNARFAAVNEFNWEIQEKKLMKLYESVLNGK